jgi:heat shock protein HslJ
MKTKLTTLGLILMTTGCSVLSSGNSTNPYGEWQLTETVQAGKSLAVADPENRFSLTLSEDGKASGQVACNSWHAQSSVDGNKMKLTTPAATSKRRCHFSDPATQELEKRFLRQLSAGGEFQLNGDQLELKLSDGEIWRFASASK